MSLPAGQVGNNNSSRGESREVVVAPLARGPRLSGGGLAMEVRSRRLGHTSTGSSMSANRVLNPVAPQTLVTVAVHRGL